jgi:hypothetical protein
VSSAKTPNDVPSFAIRAISFGSAFIAPHYITTTCIGTCFFSQYFGQNREISGTIGKKT